MDWSVLSQHSSIGARGVLVNMKEQLTKEKEGKLKNFGYDVILVYFSLEWVPLLQP